MELPQELTDIQRFYKNTNVFLTGATGFVGKLFLEKILRALPVKKVFILVRKKKDVPAEKRFEEIFTSPAFEPLKRSNPEAIQKVTLLHGDLFVPHLGLTEEDRNIIIEEVNVIFHVAANVRFDEHIKKSTFTNVRATKDLITLAHRIKKLKSFVYVGTGFSNCPRGEIKEQIYPSTITAEKLISVCENLDDECLTAVTKTLIGDWPNTYTFTKQVAEDYIGREGKGLPICITRPTIVISTIKEPIVAFVDNMFTLAGFALVNGLGLNRITYYKNFALDIVPADFVVNESVAAGWQTAELFRKNKSEVPVYNISTVLNNPITIDQLFDTIDYYGVDKAASKHLVFYSLNFRTKCKYNFYFWRTLFHSVPGYIIDTMLKIKGQKPRFKEIVDKLHRFHETYEFFITKPVFLQVENTQKMLKRMAFNDRELFNFDVTTIDWRNYFSAYTQGLRVYIYKDPIETLPEGRKHHEKLKMYFIVTMIVTAIFLYVVGKIVLFRIVPVVFGMILYALRYVICNYQ